eukprot:UN17773
MKGGDNKMIFPLQQKNTKKSAPAAGIKIFFNNMR